MKTATITCAKCNGTGHIQGFSHIQEGVCFDCNGAGVRVLKVGTVSFSREFINRYQQPGYTPPIDSDTKKVLCLYHAGRATAEEWIMLKGDSYIIGQPFCGGSSWYIIPLEEMTEFMGHFNKIRRSNFSI